MIENILNILFNIFIYPIEYLMITILDLMFNITNNYGISIILLSIIINIIILPLYYLAGKLENDNQKILDRLQPPLNRLKEQYSKQELYFYTQALYKSNYYHPINNIKASLGLLLQIPFFIAAFHFIGNYEAFNQVSFGVISNLGKTDGLLFGLNLLPFVMTIINLLSVYLYSKDMTKSERNQLLFMSFIFLVFLYFESSALLIYWSMNNLFSLFKNFIENKYNLDNFKRNAISILTIPFYKIKHNKTLNFIVKDIYIQAIVLFFGTIFIYKAIPMVASDTGMYLASYPLVVLSLIALFLISIFVAYFIYYFLPKKLKYFISILAVLGALSGLFYSFIYPFNLEILNTIRIPTFTIYEPKILKFLKLLLLAISFLFISIFFRKIQSIILGIMFLSNVLLITQTIILGFNPISTRGITKENKNLDKQDMMKFYSFSKDSNVIVILLDQFQGNIFYDILEKYPILKQELSGFTYYPNTLAYSPATTSSLGSILGGEKYKLQNKKPDIIQTSRVRFVSYDNAFLQNMKMAKQYEHSYSVYYNVHLSSCNIFQTYKDVFCNNEPFFNKENSHNKNLAISSTSNAYSGIITYLYKMSFLLSLPHGVKARVGKIFYDDTVLHNINRQDYQQLKNMNDFANTHSNKKTFKFIHSLLTHAPWSIDSSCNFINMNDRSYNGLFNSGYCSLRRLVSFFETLKKLKIYNNTKIIIMSDHGSDFKAKKIKIKTTRTSALMLVKDFNDSFDLKISNTFLSSADAYGIALSGISENKETKLDPIKNIDKNRSLLHIIANNSDHIIEKAFKVKDNIFDDNNWQELDSKQIKALTH